MKKKRIYILSCLFVVVCVFSSCTKETIEGGIEPPLPPGSTEYLSVGVNMESVVQTRAGYMGIDEEWRIKNIRFILYNGELTGSAVLIHDYDISFDSNTWNITPVNGAPANLRIQGPLTAPLITKDFEKLIKQDYRLLVLVNHNSAANANLNSIMYNGQTLNSLMSGTNHSIGILSNPIDLSLAGGSKGKTVFDYGIGPGLTGIPVNYPAPPSTFDNAAFFMSNADGLMLIDKDTDLYSSLQIAQVETNRTVVNVERSVAKVGVIKGPEYNIRTTGEGTYILANGTGLLGSVTWTTDIINYYWFIVRKQANIAPGQGGGLESSTTNRQYYYAEDPNYDGISELRTGLVHTGASKPSYHYFYVERGEDILKNWVDNPASTDNENKFKYEYVSENTMRAEEQYEDVATRVLIRANFVPLKTIDGVNINFGESYYYYNGYGLTHGQICYYLAYPDAIYSLPAELHGLRDVLFDPEVIKEFGFDEGDIISPITRGIDPDNPPKEPTVSKTKRGLTYYLHGISYYYIVIRHFTDAESPAEGGYGRFGVVRNNIYNVTVDDITGPGYIDIPKPSGKLLKSRSADPSMVDVLNPIKATINHNIW